MAIDDTLARFIKDYDEESLLRVYCWLTPTLSVGYHQKPDQRLDFDNCLRFGVGLARRPTGGRELLHDGDLSFSVVTRNRFKKSETIEKSREFFFKVGKVITSGLESFGIRAMIESGTTRPRKLSGSPCLIAASRYEIKADNKKLVPMAQRLYTDSILIHGSIPITNSQIATADLLKADNRDLLQGQIDESSTNLYQLSKKKIDIGKIKKALQLMFEEVFEGSAEPRLIPESILAEALASTSKWEIEHNSNNNK